MDDLSVVDHRIPLSDGDSIPIIGLGTYPNPKLLWATHFDPERVLTCLQKTLQLLHLDYVDLYIIEIPMALKPGDEIFPRDKKGNWLYNITIQICVLLGRKDPYAWPEIMANQGLRLPDRAFLHSMPPSGGQHTYRVVQLQVECHPYFTQRKLLEFCQKHDIVIVAYTPLGISKHPGWVTTYSELLLNDELLNSLGEKYNKTAAQVALRLNIQRGIVVILKSFNPKRIKENFQIFNFSLTKEEMKSIKTLNKNLRLVDLHMWSDHPEYPFHEEY